jgi:hypothetical protein
MRHNFLLKVIKLKIYRTDSFCVISFLINDGACSDNGDGAVFVIFGTVKKFNF